MNQNIFRTAVKPGFEYCPQTEDKVEHYTQITLTGQCVIPERKPSSRELLGIYPSVQIRKAEAISTMKLEHGEEVQGKKVVVSGFFHLGLEYLGVSGKEVHYFECTHPFSAMLLDHNGGREELFPLDFELSDYVICACLEHISIRQLSERAFTKSATLMVWLKTL